ncbi:MAG: ATP-binding protein [Gammaproteobacteria bacterium]
MLSLNSRLTLSASIVLLVFLGITGLVLDRTFFNSAKNALNDRLSGYVVALIASAEPDDQGNVHLANALPVPQFFTPGSGLYAQITGNDGRVVWRSPSAEGRTLMFPYGLERGGQRFGEIGNNGQANLYFFSIGVTWEEEVSVSDGFTFGVAEDLTSFDEQIGDFRTTLWGWLAAVVVILLAFQGIVLHWGLTPLRKVADDLAAIEAGDREQLEGAYPKELRGLTDNLNALIRSERDHLERSRRTASDLAHSLKTPLALLRGAVESHHAGTHKQLGDLVQDQVDVMSRTIEYQLQRAATAGHTALASPVPVAPVISRLVDALEKVYVEKQVSCHFDFNSESDFYGDESDLMEMLGNVMDNAYKWCAEKVEIRVYQSNGGKRNAKLVISVEDDGPGIPFDMTDKVVRRGIRGDERTEGYGIGLAIVHDIVSAYHGDILIDSSEMGGAKISLSFPGMPLL